MKLPGGWPLFLFVNAVVVALNAFVGSSAKNVLLGLVPVAAYLLGWVYGNWMGWESGWSAARGDGRKVPAVVREGSES